MCFTKKRVLDLLPTLRVNGEDIEWDNTFKYLGLTFDAPTLTWRNHIEETCRQAHQRVNILKALPGTTWGTDRENLIKIYKVFIRTKLVYGVTAIASAADSRLENLNKVQNSALRVALGARRTSPIAALQVESNVPPLNIYLKELNCIYFLKTKAQGDSHPMISDMQQDQSVVDKYWTPGIFKRPHILRAKNTLRQWNVPEDLDIKDHRIPERPPWKKKHMKIYLELQESIKKNDPTERIRAVTYETIESRFPNHLHIFTDGSKFRNSTAAGLWIPEVNHKDAQWAGGDFFPQ